MPRRVIRGHRPAFERSIFNLKQSEHELICLVLAAGAATRFGSNKCLAPAAGVPLLCRSVGIAEAVAPTYVALGAYAETNEGALRQHGACATVIRCPSWQAGMGATIAFCVATLPRSRGIMIFLADQYAVHVEDLRALAKLWRHDRTRLTCAQYNATAGVPAIFPSELRQELEHLPPHSGAKKLIAQQQDVQLLAMPRAGWDLDTPADLQHMQRLLQ